MLTEQTFNKRYARKLLGMAEGLMNNLSFTIFPSGNEGLSSWTARGPGGKTNVSSKTTTFNVRFAWRSSSKNEKGPLIGEGIAREDIQPDASRCLKPIRRISYPTLSDCFDRRLRCVPALRNGWPASAIIELTGGSGLKDKADPFWTALRLPSHPNRIFEALGSKGEIPRPIQCWGLTDLN